MENPTKMISKMWKIPHYIYEHCNSHIMQREIYSELLKWKGSKHRMPLILEGVRQCGKTHILKQFGKNEFESMQYLNFEEEPSLAKLFEKDLKPHRIISSIEALYSIEISTNTLIILDEIQCCSKALTSLKYFNEEMPDYPIVCAGSLLGLLHSTPTSFPVGKVEFMKLRPLSFPEFIMASGKEKLYDHIVTINDLSDIPEAMMNIIDDLYAEYLFVGGMPMAVMSWIESHDPVRVRKIQSDIIRLYQSDFAKYAPQNDIKKLLAIWSSLPEQLSKENRKFIFGHAVEGGRARDLEDALQWLIYAGMVMRVKLISKPSDPISSYSNGSYFKLYCSDVGLLGAIADVSYQSIMNGSEGYAEFKGAMTENYVLTELVNATGTIPYYWRSEGRAEVDFVHRIDDMTIPIEVKSGDYRKLKSLEVYMDTYSPKRAVVISKDLHKGNLVSVPLSLVWKIKDILRSR